MKTQITFKLILIMSLQFPFIKASNAQNLPTKEWDTQFGGSDFDILNALEQTADGGFILAGGSNSGISGDKTQPSFGLEDAWVLKTNSSGMKQWDVRYGGNRNDYFTTVQQTSDGGYIFGGDTYSPSGHSISQDNNGPFTTPDYWIVKTNANGVKQWDKRFGGSSYDYLTELKQTTDGGYILGGETYSPVSGDVSQASCNSFSVSDYWLVKVDSNGVKQWDARFSSSGFDDLSSLLQTNDGGYILCGNSDGSGNDCDKTYIGPIWIIKIDANGTKQWDTSLYGGNVGLVLLEQTSDGNYILGGTISESFYTDYWMAKLDTNGVEQWHTQFGGAYNDYLYSIHQTAVGGFILGGYSESSAGGNKTQATFGGYDFWVVKTDGNGIEQWDEDFGGTEQDYLYDVKQTTDGGYILGGASSSGISGNKTQASQGGDDYWIVKLGCEIPTVSITPSGTVSSCKGAPFTLTASGTAVASYQWYQNNVAVTGATNPTYTSASGTSFYVMATNGSCSAASASTVVARHNLPLAGITPLGNLDICQTGSVVLQANAGAGLSYQWKKGNNNLTGATNQNYTAAIPATYKVIVTNSNGCSKTSGAAKVTKSCRETSDANNPANDLIAAYPNPTSGKFTVDLKLNENVETDGTATIQVMNAAGQIIYSDKIPMTDNELKKEISLDNLGSAGLYLVRLTQNNKIFCSRVVFQK